MDLNVDMDDALNLSHLACELLAGYVASTDHLETIYLSWDGVTDYKFTPLVMHLAGIPNSMKRLIVKRSRIRTGGRAITPLGFRSMTQFLENSPNLVDLSMTSSCWTRMDGFRVIISSLNGGGIKCLSFRYCEIASIEALGEFTLPNLISLDLGQNNIDDSAPLDYFPHLRILTCDSAFRNENSGGYMGIAKLLQRRDSQLEELDLSSNNLGDPGAVLLADSLKHNTELTCLNLDQNDIGNEGHVAFGLLLNDMLSIDATYNSNHTLTSIEFECTDSDLAEHIQNALEINEYCYECEGPHGAGRNKVLYTQLHSQTRMVLCELQGIGYNFCSIFSEIEPVLLPNVLAMVGRQHGQDELYRMLVATVSDLASIVNKRARLLQIRAEKSAQVVALTAEILEMDDELRAMELKEKRQRWCTNK